MHAFARLLSLPLRFALPLLFAVMGACAPEPPSPALFGDALRDPTECRACHWVAYSEWDQSAHGRSTTNPIFIALLARAERDAPQDVVDACVHCHAPAAGGAVTAATLAQLPASERGINCYGCHGVVDITQDHDNGLVLDDGDNASLRGRLSSTSRVGLHTMVPDARLDRAQLASSELCVSCHDATSAAGLEFKRTGAEWRASVFGRADTGASCAACHMSGGSHAMGAGGSSVDDTWRPIDFAVFPEVCVEAIGGGIEVVARLENFAAGHDFPSGAAHHRRVWVEVEARIGDTLFFESGRVDEGVSVADVAAADPDMWTLHDTLVDDEGETVSMLWDATAVQAKALRAARGLSTLDPAYQDVHQSRAYFFVGPLPTAVTIRVRYRPVGLDVVDALIASGDLAESERDAVETYTLAASEITWTPELGSRCLPSTSR